MIFCEQVIYCSSELLWWTNVLFFIFTKLVWPTFMPNRSKWIGYFWPISSAPLLEIVCQHKLHLRRTRCVPCEVIKNFLASTCRTSSIKCAAHMAFILLKHERRCKRTASYTYIIFKIHHHETKPHPSSGLGCTAGRIGTWTLRPLLSPVRESRGCKDCGRVSVRVRF